MARNSLKHGGADEKTDPSSPLQPRVRPGANRSKEAHVIGEHVTGVIPLSRSSLGYVADLRPCRDTPRYGRPAVATGWSAESASTDG